MTLANVVPEMASRPVSQAPASHYDWLFAGAGFGGTVLAERLAAERGTRMLVVDRQPHIAGNAYCHLDEAGLLAYRYGPRSFHANSRLVFDHPSRFMDGRPYESWVLGRMDGRLAPVPINLDIINKLYGFSLTPAELEAWFAARAEVVDPIRRSEDVVVSKVGRELYRRFFRAYTRMFEWMLDHSNTTACVGANYREVRRQASFRHLVWTGPVDGFFGHRFGQLPYRFVRFVDEMLDQEWFQFTGRLATCCYLNMDQVAGQALAIFRRIGAALPQGRLSAPGLPGGA